MSATRSQTLPARHSSRERVGALLPLLEVSETLLSEVEIEKLYDLILEVVKRETGADVVSLMLLDKKVRELRVEAAVGLPEGIIGSATTKIGEGIAGWVMDKGQALLLTDGVSVETSVREAMHRDEVASAICAPLKIKGRAIGVLNASKATPESPFSNPDLELLSVLASQVAIAIENSRIHEATRGRTSQLAALNDLGRLVTSTLDLDEVLRLAMQGINEIIKAEAGSLLLLDETTNHLVFRMSLHGEVRQTAPLKLQIGQGIAGWVVKQGEPVLVRDVSSDPRYFREASEKFGLECRSILCVPIVIREHVIGAVELINKLLGEFTDEDLELLSSMAATIGIALENARLYTELAEFTRELEKSQAQLVRAEKLAAGGRIAASLAHEINNPLQAIHNCLHLVTRKPSLEDSKRQDYLSMAQEEVDRLIDLVQRMLDFYRPSKESPGPVDIEATLDDVLSLAGKRIQHAGVQVHRNPKSRLPPVTGVSNLLKQVFLNITINAVEAMPGGGELHIDTSWDDRRAEASVSFTDTGEGIPVSELARIFDPFHTTKAGGTGLGLSISHGIIERHGGRIDVRSEVGKGSTFTVRLPAEPKGVV
ncbi:MAG: GAF domain-containing protein [Anaerolineae bacterium]|nr:GAF domain-containing protein [Anaerolineae bacterium]NIN99593.1 GAF domain-containing protein [Anaerolineae bacterium]NIQ82447.1 GAF domain-containing protein [Anaerolineae bacterium]